MMYDELITVIKDLVPEARSNSQNYTASVLEKAADAIEELQKRVPKAPHGRLIDADALINNLEFTMKHCTLKGHTAQRYREMIVELSVAPTIIPAEEGET